MNTIAAISTPAGTGGIAVIRLSGDDAFEIADRVWRGKSLKTCKSHTAHLGEIISSEGETLDQAVATLFDAGRSFTGEPTVEFAIHGAVWLQREILARLIEAGAEAAPPGEFSRRAVINGRMDLAQAEGVADLIAANSRAAHRLATRQMKGEFSKRLNKLRNRMIELASLLELELDFSEEDVEFADRTRLIELCETAKTEIDKLASSFRTGKALKEGVAVVIAGIPNAGKSTLLNRLLEEEKAIVSDIAGTTRDIIEDVAEIDGILYRFIDTAGLREASDEIERIGIDRAYSRIRTADILLYLIDPTADIASQLKDLYALRSDLNPDTPFIILLTKSDLSTVDNSKTSSEDTNVSKSAETFDALLSHIKGQPSSPSCSHKIPNKVKDTVLTISARTGKGLEELTTELKALVTDELDPAQDLIVTNIRHYQALKGASVALSRTHESLTIGLSADLIAQDLRAAIHHLGIITGAITSDTILHSIFSRFCIGK